MQRILRHRDPRITTEVYGHLAHGYLQPEVDRLQFGTPIPDAAAAESSPSNALRQTPNPKRLLHLCCRAPTNVPPHPTSRVTNPFKSPSIVLHPVDSNH